MKKMLTKIKTILIITIPILLFCALYACDEPKNRGNGDPNGNNMTTTPFFDLSNLNYNPAYSNVSDSAEKGYILFDNIDFNTIRYNVSTTRKPVFEIFYNDESVATVQIPSSGTVYSDFTFDKTGVYTIEVSASAGGKAINGQFNVKVQAGGFPDRVEFELLDARRQKVNQAEGNGDYILVAKVYSESTLLSADNDKFTSSWSGGESGVREKHFYAPNQLADTILTNSFNYTCILQSGAVSRNVPFSVPVKNNYEGIEFSLGASFSEGKAELDAVDIGIHFMSFFTAKHVFTNGDKEDVIVNYQNASPIDGTVTPFIKYNGETEYHRYVKGMHSVASRFNTYISNGVSYQFDPEKTSAQIYLAYCYKEDFTGGYAYEYREVEGSAAEITITKTAPQSISVPYISGREKKADSNSGYSHFEERTVNNGAVDIMVMVTENYIGGAENQHFRPEVMLVGDSTLKDYHYVIENSSGSLYYNKVKDYFYGESAGVSVLRILSCYGEAEYELTVNILNPALEYEIDLRELTFSSVPNFFAGSLNIAPYVAIIENYYNNTSGWRRMNGEESLKYYQDATEKAIKDFVFRDEMYSITIRLYEGGNEKASNLANYSFFMMPDFSVMVDGEEYPVSDMTKSRRSSDIDDDKDGSLIFVGDIPEMRLDAAVGVQPEISISGNPAGLVASYMMGIDAYYITYTGFYRWSSFYKKQYEEVTIAVIYIDRTE
ncbi:MAG: hypothetical protein PHC84_06210 [Clostridia bacterium]|nr:hypothetical protein [Clostridia bacterium]